MNRNFKIKSGLAFASLIALTGLAGCDKPGAGERAGKQLDQAAESARQKVDQATDRVKDQASQVGQAVDDTAITGAVKAGILAEPALKVLKIDVVTQDGKVTLSGTADSAESVRKAEQIASNVQGVKGVSNRLYVQKGQS
jgi:hyperosmotically inducible protein